MLNKELIDELGGCIARQFPDEGVYRISRVEEWLSTNGYTMDKLGVSGFHELIRQAPELFGTPRYNAASYVIVKHWEGDTQTSGHPADNFFGNKNIMLNDDIIEMSQQSLYALTKVLGGGLSVQEMKQEIYDSFERAKENDKLEFRKETNKYIFPIGYCLDGYLVNGIITKNISPRGKSLYFSFEKTNIFTLGVEPKRRPSAEVSHEVKEKIYKLLTAAFQFDVTLHMAAISKLLTDHGIHHTNYGFYKMKELLAEMEYLELYEVMLGGVPQTMVIIHKSDNYQAAEYSPAHPQWTRPAESEQDKEQKAIRPAQTAQKESDTDQIPSSRLEEFCNLPPKPLMILGQYIDRCGLHRSMEELKQDLSEDFELARSKGIIHFFEGKMLFPCRWKRSDGTQVEITLKPSTYDGKPWFLHFVDTITRGVMQRTVQPGRYLEAFAFLGSWTSFLSELAEKALPEKWDFLGSSTKDYHILIQYIKYTFYRLTKENKICISGDRQFACFNTGLVDKHYDDIYACFIPNDPDCGTEWKFTGFCTAASRTLGKQVVNYFSPLPQPPVYFERGEQLFFDYRRQLLTDFDHIIIDNVDRLPLQFLREQCTDMEDVRTLIDELLRGTAGFLRKMEAYEQLRDELRKNDRLFIRIQNRLKDAIEMAKKRVSRNYKTAIPSYYPKRNIMSLMLPLCLLDEDVPDIALVVEQTHSGNYQGQTILTLPQAYVDARLLCQLNSEWLTTDIRYEYYSEDVSDEYSSEDGGVEE